MPSALEEALARHRRALLANERAAASQMVRAYGESWARIRADILRVQAQLAAGDTTLWRIQQDARLQSVQRQIEAELRIFAPYAAQSATTMQAAAIDAAMSNAAEAMELAGAPSMSIRFDKVNTGAVRAMVGFASDGSPLQTLFDGIGQDVAPRMTATLAKGIALGWGPRVTAREMRAQYGVGLNRALTIARTETLRSYREASAQVYKANADILEGWIWVCACDRRSCASCWAMHGSLHALDERLDDHPNGRCAMAAKVKGRPNRIGATGEERFAKLSADDQRAVLGPGMYEAWKDGQVSLSPTGANSIVGRHTDPQWGSMRHARSLRDIVGAEDAKGYSARAAGRSVPAPFDKRAILKIQDADSEAVQKHLVHWDLMPERVINELERNGVIVRLGAKPVPSFDGYEYLGKVHPRGWPEGATWNKVPGAYVRNDKVVLAGGGARHGGSSLVLHETGHAFGHVSTLDESNAMAEHHKRLYNKVSPYLAQGGPGGIAGMHETFAEGFADVLLDEKNARNLYDDTFVDWLLGWIR